MHFVSLFMMDVSATFVSWRLLVCLSTKSSHYYFEHMHSMARVNLNKSKKGLTSTTIASKYISKRPKICINGNPPFQTSLHKISKVVYFRLTFFFSGTKKFWPRNNFCSVFYVLERKKKFQSDVKFFEIFCFSKNIK